MPDDDPAAPMIVRDPDDGRLYARLGRAVLYAIREAVPGVAPVDVAEELAWLEGATRA